MEAQTRGPVRAPEVELLFAGLDTHIVAYVLDTRHGSPPPLHPLERTGVEQMSELRYREFAGGRACARAALSFLGVEPARAGVARGPDRAPIWPVGHRGSITHTDGWCLAVVAPASAGRHPGIDAELPDRLDAEISREVFTAAERERLADRTDRSHVLTAAFCAKEALYKAQHPVTGRWVGFTDVQARVMGPTELELAPRSDTELARRLTRPVRARWTLVVRPGGGLVSPQNIVLAAVVVDATEPPFAPPTGRPPDE